MYQKKSNKKSDKIELRCTLTEKRFIQIRARKAELTTSEYVRKIVLEGSGMKSTTLPPEVLAFNGQLNHLVAQLQPFARKRLDGDELNAIERARLQEQIKAFQQLILQIQRFFQ
jgi:hypothetical protein